MEALTRKDFQTNHFYPDISYRYDLSFSDGSEILVAVLNWDIGFK